MLLQIPENGDETWKNNDNAGIADMNINTRPAIATAL
jgi:hypothetical protein